MSLSIPPFPLIESLFIIFSACVAFAFRWWGDELCMPFLVPTSSFSAKNKFTNRHDAICAGIHFGYAYFITSDKNYFLCCILHIRGQRVSLQKRTLCDSFLGVIIWFVEFWCKKIMNKPTLWINSNRRSAFWDIHVIRPINKIISRNHLCAFLTDFFTHPISFSFTVADLTWSTTHCCVMWSRRQYSLVSEQVNNLVFKWNGAH